MSFLDFSDPDFFDVAWNDAATPVCVICGDWGLVLYSVGRQYADGYQVYEWEGGTSDSWQRMYAVEFGNSQFMMCGSGGGIQTSDDGETWLYRETGADFELHDIVNISGPIWIAVGAEGTILRTVDNGVTWTAMTSGTSVDLWGVDYNGSVIVACGYRDLVWSSDGGQTWNVYNTGDSETYYDIVYGEDKFYICGSGSTIITSEDGSSHESLTSPIEATYRAIEYSGVGGLYIIVGEDGATVTSAGGEIFDEQDSGIPEGDFYGIGYGDNRIVVVGKDGLVGYSSTGAARPAFDLFQPISDEIRAQCFTQQDAYMLYFGTLEFEEGKWNYYPRRLRCPAPGTVNDFVTIGHYILDCPGTGAILDAVAVRGGIVTAETDQLGLLTDGGSLSLPWAYQQNYGEGLKMISNLCSFNGVAYGVADDGLIYRADSVGVSRLQGFFDLTRFEDWNPGDESVWIGFDPVYQSIFIFRQKSPWTVWLVNDDTGGVSEIELPQITIGGVVYQPLSCFIIHGLHEGIYCSYGPYGGGSDEMVNVKLNIDGPITGIDTFAGGETSRFLGDISTGSFRVTSVGLRGSADEILVRTWADPDSTVRPDLAVLIREETEDDWLTNDQPAGEITVYTDRVKGVGTAFSRYGEIGLSSRNININVPEVQIAAVDAGIFYQAPFNINVPEVQIAAVDALIQDAGQGSLNINVPVVEIAAVQPAVTYPVPIGVTVPIVQIAAVDAKVSRGGYYKLPWRIDQVKIYVEAFDGTRTLASYTQTGTYEIILDTPLNAFESLYVNPTGKRPFVLGRIGDYIFTEYGAHRITAVDDFYNVQLNWYPPAECTGTYIPAQAIPEGGPEGDGKVIIGLGRGFDQLMLRIMLLPHEGCDATGAKILSVELAEKATGPELKTDA